MPTLLLLLFLLALPFACHAAESDESTMVLAELDRRFDTCYTWWGQVYDPVSGGCFYALSGKQAQASGDARFGPDIEATSKLINVLVWSGLIEQAPAAFKAGIVRYMHERQDADSGFFRDPQQAAHYDAGTLNRAVNMATDTLDICGGAPLHPLPLERVGANAEAAGHFAHLRDVQSLRTWLEALPWNRKRVWTAGAAVRTNTASLQRIEEPLRSELLAELARFTSAIQQEDGYFGATNDAWFSRLSGSYKTASSLDKLGLAIPRAEALRATVLADLYRRDYDNLIVLYNTINILTILHRRGPPLSLEERLRIARRSIVILDDFRAPDGGFLTLRGRGSPEANGKVLALPGVEANTNSTGLAHSTRSLLHELLTGQPSPHPHPRGEELLRALAP